MTATDRLVFGQEWLSSVNLKFYESKINLNWKPILKNIVEDPDAFFENGGWSFLDQEGGTDDEDVEDEDEADPEFQVSPQCCPNKRLSLSKHGKSEFQEKLQLKATGSLSKLRLLDQAMPKRYAYIEVRAAVSILEVHCGCCCNSCLELQREMSWLKSIEIRSGAAHLPALKHGLSAQVQ